MRRSLLLAAALVFVGLCIVLERAPTTWPDSQLYASVARARQLYGTGVPSSLLHSPYATDHTRFYGPVFFDLAAWSFNAFGVSKWSLRLVSLGGALVVVLAGSLLGRHFSQTGDGWVWPLALVTLTPEIGLFARTGSMDTLAVGLELLALAVFVRGMVLERRHRCHGAAAGLLLALAALTTPRTYPFIAAFFLGGLFPLAWGTRRPQALQQIVTAALVCGSIVCLWAIRTHGDPIRWVRFVVYIGLHEDTDVAILPTAVRTWSFSIARSISPFFALGGALLAARSLWIHRVGASARDGAAAFALVTGVTAFAVSVVLMNVTLELTAYYALPLFAIVASLPAASFSTGMPRFDRRLTVVCLSALVCCDLAVVGVRAARIAGTWSARDSRPLEAFLRAHVPADADVIGPFDSYFFAVEHAGAHFWVTSPQSWADWARWVPQIDPAAVGPLPRVRPTTPRFLVWDAGRDLPSPYACARPHLLATYTPVAASSPLALALAAGGNDRGFAPTALYQLPDDCPEGYDPTRVGILFKGAGVN